MQARIPQPFTEGVTDAVDVSEELVADESTIAAPDPREAPMSGVATIRPEPVIVPDVPEPPVPTMSCNVDAAGVEVIWVQEYADENESVMDGIVVPEAKRTIGWPEVTPVSERVDPPDAEPLDGLDPKVTPN